MSNGILKKDSPFLSGGTKTKEPGGNVWISKPRRIFGSRNSLVGKDNKVVQGTAEGSCETEAVRRQWELLIEKAAVSWQGTAGKGL